MIIAIAEDEMMFGEVLKKRCEECGGQIVWQTRFGREIIPLCERSRPEVLLLDIGLADGPAGWVVGALSGRQLGIKVVVVSCHHEEYLIYKMQRCGVSGFVDKGVQTIDAIAYALKALEQGRCWFSKSYVDAVECQAKDTFSFDKMLSPDDLEFIEYAVEGFTDREIAEKFGGSVRTVEGRRSRILRRLDLVNTPKLMHYARRKGFDLFVPPRFE